MREVTRGTVLAFFLKILGAGLAFGFNVVVARHLGAEGAGIYFLALSIVMVASIIARLGLDNAMLRHVAANFAHGDYGKVKGIYSLGMRMAMVSALLVTLVIYFAAPWMAVVFFSKPELIEPLQWMALFILPFVLLNLQAESLKGLKKIGDAMLIQAIGLPLMSLLFLFLLFFSSQIEGVIGVVAAYTLAAIFVTVLGALMWSRAVSKYAATPCPISVKVLWGSCKPLFVISIFGNAILPFAPLFLLGIWEDSYELGLFGAASQVALIVSMMLVVVNNVVAPKFAELYAKEDMKALENTAQKTSITITLLVSPVLLMLIFFGQPVMGVFGSEYEGGALILAILAGGQMVNLMTGSVGYLLMMSGHAAALRDLTIMSAIILILALLALIPMWGGVGAALASALSLVFLNVAAVWMVHRKLGIHATFFQKIAIKRALHER